MAFKVALLVFCSLFSASLSLPASVSRATRIATRSRVLLSLPIKEGRTLKARRKRKAASSREVGTTCSWNEDNGACEPSVAVTADYLNSDFASLVSEFAACERAETKKSCNNAGNCIWDSDEKSCYFVDVLSGREDSLCYEKAPGAVGLVVFSGLCSRITSNKTCSSESQCFWNEEDMECASDPFNLFYGFDLEEYETGIDALIPLWQQDLLSTYNIIGNPSFAWSAILRWRPSQSCIEDATPELCAYISEGIVPLMPNVFYCVFQYSQPQQKTACNEDIYCEYIDDEQGCSSAESADLGLAAISATLDQVDVKLDRTIFTKSMDCSEKPENKCKGRCIWSEQDDLCTLSDSWAFGKVAAVDKRGEDTLCKYLKAASDSGCLDLLTEDDCTAFSACSWRTLDEQCFPSIGYLTKLAAEEEDKSESFRRLEKKCSKRKSASDCRSVTR